MLNHLFLGEENCIHCDTTMELVSVINAMNPGMNTKTDSEILSRIQQVGLWIK
jgi:Menin.